MLIHIPAAVSRFGVLALMYYSTKGTPSGSCRNTVLQEIKMDVILEMSAFVLYFATNSNILLMFAVFACVAYMCKTRRIHTCRYVSFAVLFWRSLEPTTYYFNIGFVLVDMCKSLHTAVHMHKKITCTQPRMYVDAIAGLLMVLSLPLRDHNLLYMCSCITTPTCKFSMFLEKIEAPDVVALVMCVVQFLNVNDH